MALAIDSAKPLLDEVVRSLRRLEEILAYVGIFYVGRLTLPTLWEVFKGLRTHVLPKFMPPRLVERYGKWAVVTGLADGISKAYAVELARNGMNLVLISCTIEKLQKLAHEISQEFGVETEVVQADFCNGRGIYDDISKTLSKKDIGILVNNVGMLTPPSMLMEDISEDDMWGMVNANVGSTPAMTKIVLPGMVERKRGAIINISAPGTCVPLPFKQICTASKAFVESYSRALEYEYRSSGILVQTVLPGLVVTDPNGNSFRPYIFVPSASTYAYHALGTLSYSRRTTGYWAHGVLAWFLQRVPESMMMWSYALVYKPNAQQKKTE